MSNVEEIAGRLVQLGESVSNSVNGGVQRADGILTDAGAAIQNCKMLAEEPTNEVASLLGENHPGYDAIVGNTARVSELLLAAGEMQILISYKLAEVEGALATLKFVYENVGNSLRNGM